MKSREDYQETATPDSAGAAVTARRMNEREHDRYREYIDDPSGKRKQRRKRLIGGGIVFAVIVIAVIIVLIVQSGYGNNPEGVIRRFEDGFNELDTEKIAACFPPENREHFADSADSAAAEMKSFREMMPTLEIRVKSVDYNGDKTAATAQVDMVMTGGIYDLLGESEPVVEASRIALIKSDGKWYLESASEDPFDIFD